MERLETIFAQHSLRLTTPRKAVFLALEQSETPQFISRLVKTCPNIDRTSIYRTLELFSRLGIIEIIHTGFKKRYELAGPFKPHHHHLQCNVCGELVAIDTPRLEELVAATATANNYQLTSHHIELHGVCQNCQKVVQ
jgi:Fe2+ or Zn2+ uptake regulation protein